MKEEILTVFDRLFEELPTHDTRILDAATGAGFTTCELAQRVKGTVISVDIDPSQAAQERIKDANLLSKVEFIKGNLAKMDFLDENSIDAVVSHSTLSSIPAETPFMLLHVLREFYRVLKPAGILLIIDYYPLSAVPVRNKPDKIAEDAWRVYKSVAELVGDHHHEELPPEWVGETLIDVGFTNVSHEKIFERALDESFEEYIENMLEYIKEIEDRGLRKAFKSKIKQLKKDAKIHGKSSYSDTYCVWARK